MAFGGGVEPREARRILDAFMAHGGTFVDAANTFGGVEGERILGEALRGRRDRVVIGTKFGRSTDSAAGGAGSAGVGCKAALSFEGGRR